MFVPCVAAIGAALAGCGGGDSGGSSGPGGSTPQNTQVPVLLSSTGNDRLSRFYVTIAGLSLTNRSGHTVDVLTKTQSAEFMHLNGAVEPLLTATVPQDTYVSASVSVSYASFTCIANTPTGLDFSTYATNPPVTTAVKLANPVTVGSGGSALLLSLDTLQSAQYSSCSSIDGSNGLPASTTALAPVFELSVEPLAAQPTNSANGKATNLIGMVTSVNAAQGSFAVSNSDGLAWSIGSTGGTTFQGISGISALSAGMAVDMDVAIQADGSLLADRVAVPDTNSSSLSTFSGQLTSIVSASPEIYQYAATDQGALWAYLPVGEDGPSVGAQPLDVTNTGYQWSGRFANVNTLPFTASFDGSNIVPGQSTYVTNHQIYLKCCQLDPATTVTLMPQTIDGAITAISSSGGFTTYTVSLASYDSFPGLSVQQGQTTALQQPNTVIVYADSNTQMLNAAAASVGSVLRFNGLIFNDHGTLRMDCGEILDGLAQ